MFFSLLDDDMMSAVSIIGYKIGKQGLFFSTPFILEGKTPSGFAFLFLSAMCNGLIVTICLLLKACLSRGLSHFNGVRI